MAARIGSYAEFWPFYLAEHSKPATFTYPVWSLLSDLLMSAMALTGRLGPELEKSQVRPRA